MTPTVQIRRGGSEGQSYCPKSPAGEEQNWALPGPHKQPSPVLCPCLERVLTPSLTPESSTHHLFHSKPSSRPSSLAPSSGKPSLTTPATPRHLCYPLSPTHTHGLPVWVIFSTLPWAGRGFSSSVAGAHLSNVEFTIVFVLIFK